MAGLMGTSSFTQSLAESRAGTGGSGLLKSRTVTPVAAAPPAPNYEPSTPTPNEAYGRAGERAAGSYSQPQYRAQTDMKQPSYPEFHKAINLGNLGAISGAAKENSYSNRNDAGTGVVSHGGPAVPQFQAPQGPEFDPKDPRNAALAGYMMG